MVSNKNKVLPHLNTLSLNNSAITRANPVVRKYFASIIQKGVMLSNKSLSVPPPIAVTKPIMYTPNQSICLPDAILMPLIAKENMPMRSKSMVKFS